MQNKKVSEYLENINDERLYSNKKYFKKYYINYIIYLMNTLYIDIPATDATDATAATAATVNNPLRYIPCIDMIVL
jgi:ERCC4-type nuclease